MAETATKPTIATRPSVMVIDDQPLIADTLAEILKQNGYDSVALYSAEDALRSLTLSKPAIVLSDVRMHRLNGIQAAVLMRGIHPTCRIILFSASPISESEQATIDECGFEFLARPLRPDEVLKQLQSRKNGKVLPFRTPRSA